MRAGSDDGMVTAELAAGLPVLVLLLAFAISVVGVGGADLRVTDAAREAARAAARGDRAAGVRLAHEAAPGAAVAITESGDSVTVVVRLPHHLLVPWLPAVTVTGRAVAALEPGEGP
jgi:Flp pilus assembly protein TadG